MLGWTWLGWFGVGSELAGHGLCCVWAALRMYWAGLSMEWVGKGRCQALVMSVMVWDDIGLSGPGLGLGWVILGMCKALAGHGLSIGIIWLGLGISWECGWSGLCRL